MREAARRERAGSVVRAAFGPLVERRSVLDRAHRGDVEGALGRLPAVVPGPRATPRVQVGGGGR